ncbi:MAG: hypothetical protein K9K86_04540, partial [Pseudomonadales bacterium]|nr:hypothetical protein [Pseudomonadales bacterium]
MQSLSEIASIDLTSEDASAKLPLELNATLNGRPQKFTCVEQFRLLPAKRAVYKAYVHNRPVIIKAFNGIGSKKYLTREITGLHALTAAGIPTPTINDSGLLEENKTEVLILEYLEGSTSLGDLLSNSDQPTQLNLLKKAVVTIAKMHNRGIRQEDIHPENFLLKEGICYVIDGASVISSDKGRAPPSKKYLTNLALFCAQIALIQQSLVDQLYILYCQERETDCQFSAVQLWREVVIQQKQRTHRYLDKIYRDCTQVKAEKKWHHLLAYTRRFGSPGLNALLADPDAFIARGKLLKDGNSSTVALIEVEGFFYVVKRYNLKNIWHWLSRCWRESRASISWRNANLLLLLGIDTPCPIALLEKRFGAIRRTSYFITEYIEAPDLRALFAAQDPPTGIRKQIKTHLKSLLKKLQMAKISHGDFKATNFLVTNDRLIIIDLDAMQWHK